MIDWLRRRQEQPAVDLGDRHLPLVIRRHPRATRMILRLAPDGSEARVTLPQWGRTAEALAFARSRADWLAAQLAAIAQVRPPVPDGTIRYRGRELRVDWCAQAQRKPVLDPDAIRIGGPAHGLPGRLQRWLEAEARGLFAADLAHYCDRAGVTVPALALSRAQRRWGSCSGTGTIRINWRLVQAPDAVRRSVVAHEVAHLLHFDHGKAFHAALAALFEGDLAQANRWLKREGRGLYSDFG
jgi:predicted metal-dependent hydrolase